MSNAAVVQGITNPREIQKLIKRGVKVYTRSSLHAKFMICGKTLITGSANISTNSQQVLDEAAIATTDPAAVKRARAFFDQLCTEPIRPEYLKQCIEAYNPPNFKTGSKRNGDGRKQPRIKEAKLWFLAGLVALELADEARESIGELERKAEKKLSNGELSEVTWVRYSQRPKFMDSIRSGDWVVTCMMDGSTHYVSPPAQVLYQDVWKSPKSKRYEILMLESPADGESLTFGQFRKRVKTFEARLDRANPRSVAIENQEHADRILRFWTEKGRVSKAKARN